MYLVVANGQLVIYSHLELILQSLIKLVSQLQIHYVTFMIRKSPIIEIRARLVDERVVMLLGTI